MAGSGRVAGGIVLFIFKNITNPPTPIQRVLEKYPAPPYTTTEVSPRLSVA